MSTPSGVAGGAAAFAMLQQQMLFLQAANAAAAQQQQQREGANAATHSPATTAPAATTLPALPLPADVDQHINMQAYAASASLPSSGDKRSSSQMRAAEDDGESNAKRAKWTAQEDEMLRAAVAEHGGRNWKKIAQSAFGGNKSDVQCLHRWQKVLDPKLVKGPWTAAEDARVIALVAEHGAQKWSLIASHLPGRIGKQCRERWHNHLDPEIKKEQWTPEEDQVVMALHQALGNQWAVISATMHKCGLGLRPDNAIKNRWNSSMKRKFISTPPARIDENGMVHLPGVGPVPIATPASRHDEESDDEDNPGSAKKSKSASKRKAINAVIAAANAANAAAAAPPTNDAVASPSAAPATSLTATPLKAAEPASGKKRARSQSASKVSARKRTARDDKDAPAPAPRKSQSARKPPMAAIARTRPMRSAATSARGNWASALGSDSDAEQTEEEQPNASAEAETDAAAEEERKQAAASDSEGDEPEDVELTLAGAPRGDAREGSLMLPSTPSHRRGGSGLALGLAPQSSPSPFLSTPAVLRTPARSRAGSTSPGEEKKSFAYEAATPMRPLGSPGAALSLASPSAALLASPGGVGVGGVGSVFSPAGGLGGAGARMRPLSTPLGPRAGRFGPTSAAQGLTSSLIAPRTPASPSHAHSAATHTHSLLAPPPASGLGLAMHHTPGARLGLGLMSPAFDEPVSADSHDDKKPSAGLLSPAAHHGGGAFTSPSSFISLSRATQGSHPHAHHHPLLQTPLVRYTLGTATPGMATGGATLVPPSSAAAVHSPGMVDSFFQSPARLLSRSASARGKRALGLEFAAPGSGAGEDGRATPSAEYLASPPPLARPSIASAAAAAVAAASAAAQAESAAGSSSSGGSSVQQLLSVLKSQAAASSNAASGPCSPAPTISASVSQTRTPSSSVATPASSAATPISSNTPASTAVATPMPGLQSCSTSPAVTIADTPATVVPGEAASPSLGSRRLRDSEMEGLGIPFAQEAIDAMPVFHNQTDAALATPQRPKKLNAIVGSPLLAFANMLESSV